MGAESAVPVMLTSGSVSRVEGSRISSLGWVCALDEELPCGCDRVCDTVFEVLSLFVVVLCPAVLPTGAEAEGGVAM
jgi:hypothetical protein